MKHKDFKNKFSRHIGRILVKLSEQDIDDCIKNDIVDYTKGEIWLLCEDLILMLNIKEQTNNEKEINYNK